MYISLHAVQASSPSLMEGSSGVRKGAWSKLEDDLLRDCVNVHGEGKWHLVPQRAGLNRCRKSCRLRWLNYLKPNIKRGDFSEDEVDLMIRMHKLLGNRWSLIAGRLPGRTSNDVKNYWNMHMRRKVQSHEKAKNNAKKREGEGKAETAATATPHEVMKPAPRAFFSSRTTPCLQVGVGEEGATWSGNWRKTLLDDKGEDNNTCFFGERDGALNLWNQELTNSIDCDLTFLVKKVKLIGAIIFLT